MVEIKIRSEGKFNRARLSLTGALGFVEHAKAELTGTTKVLITLLCIGFLSGSVRVPIK